MKLIYWKNVKLRGLKGKYIVSNYGDVINLHTHKLVTPSKIYNGALKYCLWKNDKVRVIVAHKLVWHHFKKSELGTNFIMHLDYNKENNWSPNLDKLKRGDYLRLWNEYKNKVRGVYKHQSSRKLSTGKIRYYTKWRAVLKVNNRVKTLGYYKTKKEATLGYFEGYLNIYKRPPFELK